MLGVGPGIREMKIQDENGSRIFDLPGQRNCVLEYVIGSIPYRRHKDTNTESVPTMTPKDGQFIAGLPIFLIHR